MHRCCHERCKTALIGKIDLCTGVNEPARRFLILLRHCNQQRGAPLRVAPIRIDVLHQAQVDERIALNGDSSNQFFRRHRYTRRRLGTNRYCPK
ncbi:MAG: hypothetical protein DME52_02075 [Verrucomicrobia bacterium]|nr:MAG: hypothetical protein DME52_02075 [Verrucomicrobiota bacterium]PYK51131.1 MAG: hypothetical protein DME51_03905 [Verrucomicrobiota bacterium]